MMKRGLFAMAFLLASAVGAAPASAQLGGRLSVEPYVGYGFLGELPETSVVLESDVAFGGRAAFHLSPQWAVFGNYQRATPAVEGLVDREAELVHWSAGVEFSYVPRGGAEGMLPVILEAGLGQARYDFQGVLGDTQESDIAANIGIFSALQLTPNFAIRYGANDYISNFRDNGIVNHVFARIGAEVTF